MLRHSEKSNNETTTFIVQYVYLLSGNIFLIAFDFRFYCFYLYDMNIIQNAVIRYILLVSEIGNLQLWLRFNTYKAINMHLGYRQIFISVMNEE